MPKGLYQPQGSKADVVTSCPAFKIKSSLQIIFVSKEVILSGHAGTSFDLTRSQSGRTKHVFPSRVYASWYCGPVIKSKCSIFVLKHFKLHSFYIGSQMPCQSVRPG